MNEARVWAVSYAALLDDYCARDNTPEARVAATGIPLGWGFGTFPNPELPHYTLLTQWAATPVPRTRGLVLFGGAGVGKTGLVLSVVRACAERADGSRGIWNLVTHPAAREAVTAGTFRARPAPVWWAPWRALKTLLDLAKTGQPPFEEEPPLTAEKVLAEIADRTDMLALDDIDVDIMSPWKEEILLRLCERPASGQRLVLTLNTDPTSPAGIDRLGERLVDRLMDTSMFAQFRFSGLPSLRRR